MALPALGSVRPESLSFAQASSVKPNYKLVYGTLGRTGLKVTRMAFGCMTTSDASVIERAADNGINLFDSARVDQLDETLRAMSSPFTATDRKLLAARPEEIRPLYCRMCGSCGGTCPKGLPVADMLRYLMYAESYGQFSLGRENYQSLGPELTRVRCSDCESCNVRCPNGVKVAERLTRSQEVFG
jgi:predicted aldo/keto reductase-like oxidoreductase